MPFHNCRVPGLFCQDIFCFLITFIRDGQSSIFSICSSLQSVRLFRCPCSPLAVNISCLPDRWNFSFFSLFDLTQLMSCSWHYLFLIRKPKKVPEDLEDRKSHQQNIKSATELKTNKSFPHCNIRPQTHYPLMWRLWIDRTQRLSHLSPLFVKLSFDHRELSTSIDVIPVSTKCRSILDCSATPLLSFLYITRRHFWARPSALLNHPSIRNVCVLRGCNHYHCSAASVCGPVASQMTHSTLKLPGIFVQALNITFKFLV